jgi:DNA helicase-2/ATP-dependent DNA helicase PcrA
VAVLKSIASSPLFQADERQREAIEHIRGPILVVAGAGTGKTTVLTQRIARLIREGHARPDEILAVTYTENAAREIRERVQGELRGSDIKGLQANTFHGYCNELLIRNDLQFGVLDEKDLWVYLRRRLHELHLKYFVRAANVGQFLKDLLEFISHCHDELVTVERYEQYVEQLERGKAPIPRIGKSKNPLPDEEVLERCREIASVFRTVERMLDEENLGSFGHMITRAYALLQKDPELRTREQAKAKFILVDEFQDANFAQVRILQTIAGPEQSVFAVGDPDQSVYRFRGASSAAFGLFQRSFPAAKLVVLGKNRRSTTAILNTAFAVIERNPPAAIEDGSSHVTFKRSRLISARDEQLAAAGTKQPHPPVEAVVLSTKDMESLDLVETLRERKRVSGTKWSDIAILFRIHSHCEQLAAELAEQDIPFSIENMNVLDTTEARDLLACAGAVLSSADGASLFRVAAFPQWKVDAGKLRVLIAGLPREAPATAMYSLLGKVEGGAEVIAAIESARREIEEAKAGAHAALCMITGKFGIARQSAVISAILEFAHKWEEKPVTKTRSLGEFMEYFSYFREAGGAICVPEARRDAVQLMTAHGAKGLEWKHVFIIRANRNSFPMNYKESLVAFPPELLDPDSVAEADDKELCNQEERRLFYVAMTRARDSLAIYAKEGTGKTDKSPAGIVRDLMKDPGVAPWFRHRRAREFQTALFAQGEPAYGYARMSEWLNLPPAGDLSLKLSASAVQNYQTCPLQFKLQREWRIPADVPGAMQYGASVHRVLRTFFDAVRFGREIGDEEVLKQFRQDLENASFQDRYQFQLYLEQGEQQLRDFLAAWRARPQAEVLHTEEWFDVPLGNTTLVGRIDRMDRADDGRVTVIDYKTGKAKSAEDADESLQLSIYALAVRQKWGYEIDRLVFHNLEENAPVATHRDEAQIQGARCAVEETAARIAAAEFAPRPGFHCGYCFYRSLCPATEKRSFIPVAKPASQKT